MSDSFLYNLFLSQSSNDKAVMRPLPHRLRKDGLKVWFDEWVLKPSDSIPARIEKRFARARALHVSGAFGSDWKQLKSGKFRFHDPLNKERRALFFGNHV